MTRGSTVLGALLLLLFARPLAAFDGIRLTLLGAGERSAQDAPVGPGILVEAGDEVLLFDCGVGSLERLRSARFRLRELTAVFLTSLDATHVGGCGELIAARLRADGEQPLLLWGPGGTIQAVQAWVGARGGGGLEGIDPHEVGENLVYDTDDVRVTAIVTDHATEPRAYGYRVDRERRAVVVLAAARYSENVVHGARGAQAVVSDVAAATAQEEAADAAVRGALASHTSPEDAGRIMNGARAYLGLYSHLQLFGVAVEEVVARTRRYYHGPLQIGRALMIVEIQNEVQIRSAPSDGPRQ
jgi:ribonuclease Z